MLKIKELEDYLDVGTFEYGYIEMHAGPHDIGLYVEDDYITWVKIGKDYYSFDISVYGTSSEDTKEYQHVVERLDIYKRGKKTTDKNKYARKTEDDYYYEFDKIFSGTLENKEDLIRLFKQLGIK